MPSADASRLRAGVDYPKDLTEFDRFLPDEEACERFWIHCRLGDHGAQYGANALTIERMLGLNSYQSEATRCGR